MNDRVDEISRLVMTQQTDIDTVSNSREQLLTQNGFRMLPIIFSLDDHVGIVRERGIRNIISSYEKNHGEGSIVTILGGITILNGEIHHLPEDSVSIFVREATE